MTIIHRFLGRILRILSAAILSLSLLTPGFAQDDSPGYTLGPGDKLKVTVFGHDDLSGEFDVDGDGLVSLPLVGSVKLGGETIAQAERTIIDVLKPDYLKNPSVSVQVLNYRPFYIIGEVNDPGSYPYVNGLTVLEAVAIAGGFTHRAKESRMTIKRAMDPTKTEEDVKPDSLVLPGDVIEVPERFF